MSKHTVDLDDFEWDPDLDNLELGLDEDSKLNKEVGKKTRKPIERVYRGVISGAKQEASNPTFLKNIALKSLPKEYEYPLQAMGEVKNDIASLYDDAVKELKPRMGSLATQVNKLIPDEQRYLKRVSAKLKQVLGGEDTPRYRPPSRSEEDLRSEGGVEEVFQPQAEARSAAERNIRERIEDKRYTRLSGVAESIDQNLSRLASYNDKINLAYQKKSLELQFRSYYVQKELLEATRRFAETTRAQNEGLITNTGLPDFVKLRKSERFADLTRTKFMDSLREGLFGNSNYVKKATEKLRTKALEKIGNFTFGLDALEMGLGGAVDMKEAADLEREMGFGGPEDKVTRRAKLGGKLGAMAGGGYLRTKLNQVLEKSPRVRKAGYLASKYARNLPGLIEDLNQSDFIRKAEDRVFDADMDTVDASLQTDSKDRLKGWLKAKSKKLSGWAGLGGRAFLETIAPGGPDLALAQPSGGFGLNQPAVWDGRAQTTLNTVIPGYLARIYREIQVFRTGNEKIDLTLFDHTKSRFSGKANLTQTLGKALKGKAQDRGYARQINSLLQDLDKEGTLSSEARKALGNLLNTTAFTQNRLDSKALLEERNFEKLPQTVAQELKTHLTQSLGVNTAGFEAKDHALSKKLLDLKESSGDIRQTVQQLHDLGYGNLLRDMGLVKKGVIDKEAYLKLLWESGMMEPSARQAGSLGLRDSNAEASRAKARQEGIQLRRFSPLSGQLALKPPYLNDRHRRVTPRPPEAGAYSRRRLREGLAQRREQLKSSMDLYLRGQLTPALEARRLEAGEYFDQVTSKVLTSVQDIQGPVVDATGRVVVSLRDLKLGLVTPEGTSVVPRLPKLLESAGGFSRLALPEKVRLGGQWLKATLKLEQARTAIDVYVKGKISPALEAKSLQAGEYFDQLTGKALTSISQIKGPIVDRTGQVVLSLQDLKTGLVNAKGRPIRPLLAKVFEGLKTIRGLDIKLLKAGWGYAKGLGHLLPGHRKAQTSEAPPGADPGRPAVPSSQASSGINPLGLLTRGKELWKQFKTQGKPKTPAPGAPETPLPDADQKPKSLLSLVGSGLLAAAKALPSAPTVQSTVPLGVPQPEGEKRRKGHWETLLEAGQRKKEEREKNRKVNLASLDPRYKSAKNVFDELIEKAGSAMAGITEGLSSLSDLFGGGEGLGRKKKGFLRRTAGRVGRLGRRAGRWAMGAPGRIAQAAGKVGRGVLGAGRLAGGVAEAGLGAAGVAARAGGMAMRAGGRVATGLRAVGTPLVSLIGRAGSLSGMANILSKVGYLRTGLMAAGLLTGGAGGAVLGTIGAGLSLIGSALASPLVMGAAAAGALGYGAYKAYKYFTRNQITPLTTVRLRQYGFGEAQKSNYHRVLGLEGFLEKEVLAYTAGDPYLHTGKLQSSLPQVLDLFDIDPQDDQMLMQFMQWFQNRFKPVYLAHVKALYQIDPKRPLTEVDKLQDDLKLRYLNATALDNGPYTEMASPLKEFTAMAASKNHVLEAIEAAKLEITPSKEDKSGKVLSPYERKLAAEKAKKDAEVKEKIAQAGQPSGFFDKATAGLKGAYDKAVDFTSRNIVEPTVGLAKGAYEGAKAGYEKAVDYTSRNIVEPLAQGYEGVKGSVSDLIHMGESKRRGYNDYNRGSDRRAGSNKANLDLSNMTLAEILEKQALPIGHPDRLFAVGKYQVIPATMKDAIQKLGVDTQQKFTPALQEKLFTEYLATGKKGRGALENYIKSGKGSPEKAAHAIAQEWASVESPVLGRGVYDGVGNNSAHIKSKAMLPAIEAARQKYAELKAQGMGDKEAYATALGSTPTTTVPAPAYASQTGTDPTGQAGSRGFASSTQGTSPIPGRPSQPTVAPTAGDQTAQGIYAAREALYQGLGSTLPFKAEVPTLPGVPGLDPLTPPSSPGGPGRPFMLGSLGVNPLTPVNLPSPPTPPPVAVEPELPPRPVPTVQAPRPGLIGMPGGPVAPAGDSGTGNFLGIQQGLGSIGDTLQKSYDVQKQILEAAQQMVELLRTNRQAPAAPTEAKAETSSATPQVTPTGFERRRESRPLPQPVVPLNRGNA
jgi:hypothetical protein